MSELEKKQFENEQVLSKRINTITLEEAFLSTIDYLMDMFGSTNTTWTLNTDRNQVWYVSATGNLGLASSTDNKQIYAVVKLSSNTHITITDNGTGASNNPFVIK